MNLFPGLSDINFKQGIDDMSASSKVSGIDHNLSFSWEIGEIVIYVVHYFPYPFINLVQDRHKIGRNVDYIKLGWTVQQIKKRILKDPVLVQVIESRQVWTSLYWIWIAICWYTKLVSAVMVT